MADAVELEIKLRLTERELEEKTALLESLQSTVLVVTEQNNDLQEHNATLKKVQALLMERVAEAQREAEVFLKEKAEVSAENGRLHLAAKTLRRKVDDLQAELDAAKAEVETLSSASAHPAVAAAVPPSSPSAVSPPRDRSVSAGDASALPRAGAGLDDAVGGVGPSALRSLSHLPGQIRRTPPGGDGHLVEGGRRRLSSAGLAPTEEAEEDVGVGRDSGGDGDGNVGDGDSSRPRQEPNLEAYMEALSRARHQLKEQEMAHKLELDKLSAQLHKARADAASGPKSPLPSSLGPPTGARDENGGSGHGSGGRLPRSATSSSSTSGDTDGHHHQIQHGEIISVSSGSGPYPRHAGQDGGGGGGGRDVKSTSGDGFGASLLSSLLWPFTELTQAVSGGVSKPRGFAKAHQVLQL